MRWLVRTLLLGALFMSAACSMESALDKLVSDDDRVFAQRFVAHLRKGDVESLEPQFDPELWVDSAGHLSKARTYFPAGEGTTRLIGYNVSTNVRNGSSTTSKQYMLVTAADGQWTRTRIVTLARNGPARVVEWNVDRFNEPPPELQMYESWERIVPWVQAGLAIVLLGFIALIWWLVRRSRRRAA